MISQNLFRLWLSAPKQQTTTLANDDPDLYRHMSSQSHNEVTYILYLRLNHEEVITRHTISYMYCY